MWYIIAALGAGIGTGLAGLSAATVMVPILLVLCPSFAAETGAYQATAIALTSDILGSAVTAYTYAKHKNIDLKRGWVMLVCILGMCIFGSYVAFLVGNVVLGSFTLFLTFFIGIRFLLKPDTSRKNTADKGEKLDWKGVAISLFFGLTIGFGSGFVGTGGGMMMLVVFTAFLGMELKTAVGTSTFIMTFTALIASVSHILIHPAILLDQWDVMLLCSAVATAASLFSARFANRVNNRTLGLATGAALTVLGAAMLFLNFWPQISALPLALQTLSCFGRLILFIIPCVLALLLIRFMTKIPAYAFRKLMHVVAFTCFTVMMLTAESWQAAALTSVMMALGIYPLLLLVENENWYGRFFVQKSQGEIKRSLLMLFIMFAAVITVAWGILENPHIAAASILMWGMGDASAALMGIPYGKHKIRTRFAVKSWEGTIAMFAAAFLSGAIVLHFFGGFSIGRSILAVLPASVIAAVTELFSPSEWDTVTVPAGVLIVLLLTV